ncbi:hypothetical protein [Reyranella soli]|uniref:Uncharacterized protein n=1 Tax=Reyranella soli TaxID=1230389 RepID=A0A512NSE2_9HYPH|nr:hypothetical protein [Reyranella soli]GEP61866.1 hypothetical protein RSO01_90320 [Reyranella soli]
MDECKTDQLVFYAFDLLFLDKRLFRRKVAGLLYSEHSAASLMRGMINQLPWGVQY